MSINPLKTMRAKCMLTEQTAEPSDSILLRALRRLQTPLLHTNNCVFILPEDFASLRLGMWLMHTCSVSVTDVGHIIDYNKF